MLFPTLESASPRDALRFGEVSLRYAELAGRARAHALSLLDAGIQPGDRVGVWASASIGAAVAFVGHALAGIVSVPVPPAQDDAALAHLLRETAPRCIVGLPPGRSVGAPGASLGGGSSIAGSSATSSLPEVDAGAPLLVLTTSGTTGAPKGVVHTGRSIAANLDALAAAWELSPRDVIVHALPLFHAHGLVLGLFGALRAGATLRVLPRFDAVEVAGELGAGGTVLYASPAQLQDLGERTERDAASAHAVARARLLVTGSAPFPIRESTRLLRTTGQRVVERYGITETFINASSRVHGERRPGHVGTALDGVELRLVDDARNPVSDALGEIAVRGPNLFAGYLNRPEATRAVVDADGWFYTGDLGTLDAMGTLRIVGRRSTDLIRATGGLVAAGEIEAALLEQDEVREAAVVGVADGDAPERIVAFVALRAGARADAAELLERAGAELAPHKRPGALKVLSALPRNAIGKVVKTALRAAAAQ